jgi:TRAP-type mannitol/chloroaromatic compound transport system substrate-binding protein
MTDDEPNGVWLSANEAAVKFAVTKAHLYVLASRQRWQSKLFNDMVKRYYIPYSYERKPNVELIVTNNSADIQDDSKESLLNQLNEAKDQLRQIEVARLEEQINILQEDKVYLRDKLDEVQSQLPQILDMIGKLHQDNTNYKNKIAEISTEKDKYKSLLDEQDKISYELKKERDGYKDVMLSLYKKFIHK